jgi:hypothetical protein
LKQAKEVIEPRVGGRALCREEFDVTAVIDIRRNSHEGYIAFSRIKFDATNYRLGCVGDLPSKVL